MTNEDKLFIKDLLENISIICYQDNFKETIVNIRNKKKLKQPDAIIAATAINWWLPLITFDKAFKNFPELNLIFYDVNN